MKSIHCAIYKGHKKYDSYLFIEKQDDFSRVPESLLNMLGNLELVMILELDENKKLAQADVIKVMGALQEEGFYLQMPDKSEQLKLAGFKPNSHHLPKM